jgi:hypothetical protein
VGDRALLVSMSILNLKKFGDLKIWSSKIHLFEWFNYLIWFDTKKCWIKIEVFKFSYLDWFCKNELNWKKSIWHKNSIAETFSTSKYNSQGLALIRLVEATCQSSLFCKSMSETVNKFDFYWHQVDDDGNIETYD